MQATDVIRARIDSATKARASAALARMGLSVSDAIRMMMHRVAEDERLPFDVRVPNAASREAMAELGAGKDMTKLKAVFLQLIEDQPLAAPASPPTMRSSRRSTVSCAASV